MKWFLETTMSRIQLARWLFRRRFEAEGIFESAECPDRESRPVALHNLWLPVMPLDSEDETREEALHRFREMNSWLSSIRLLIPRADMCQCVVGFPLFLKSGGNQIFKWWFPARALKRISRIEFPSDMKTVGGGGIELLSWSCGLWGNPMFWDEAQLLERINNVNPKDY